jgi:hypothetical protein
MPFVNVIYVQVIPVYMMDFAQIKIENILDSKITTKIMGKKIFNIYLVHIFKCR